MRQGQQNRRGRGRGGRKSQNPLARNYESNGPDVKIRGTAAHIAEKYMSLARDALSAGDSVGAESYLQHAEHYNRIIMAAQTQQQGSQGNQPNDGANGSNYRGRSDDDDSSDDADDSDQDEEAAAPRNERPRRNSKRNGNGAEKNAQNTQEDRDRREARDDHDEHSSAGGKPQEEGASEEAVG